MIDSTVGARFSLVSNAKDMNEKQRYRSHKQDNGRKTPAEKYIL